MVQVSFSNIQDLHLRPSGRNPALEKGESFLIFSQYPGYWVENPLFIVVLCVLF
jgi:hypothetical protein